MKYKYNGQWYDLSIKALDGMPIGSIILFAGETIPTGWMICDGTSLAEEEYPELFDVIRYKYGGSGLDFNLPNFKGRVPVGLDSTQTEFDTLGETGGEKTVQLTTDNLASNVISTSTTGSNADGYIMRGGYTASGTYNIGGIGAPHNNLQPYLTVNYIIKATNTTPTMASVVNAKSVSTIDTYSCNYINNNILDTYSLNEIKTNKIWADGKPIYRKVISFSTSPTINAWDYQAHGITNMDKPMPTCSLMIMYNGSWYYCPNDLVIEMYINTTNLAYYNNSNALADKPAFAVIEYTKTTN